MHVAKNLENVASQILTQLCYWFSTVDQQVLLRKLEYYRITGNNLRYFENYLKNPKKFLSFEQNPTKKLQ